MISRSKNLIPTLYITGDIDSEAFTRFSRKIKRYEREGKKKLNLELISEGGDAYSALAFYDLIKRTPIEITAVATGLVASAATLIFIACSKRYMTKNSYLMVHEDSLSGIEDGKVSQIEKEAKHARRLENQWDALFYESTAISETYWCKLNKEETFLSAEECRKLCIIEGIL